jgi:Tfp pilus assembly protein PilE
MMRLARKANSKKSFTLIELLLVSVLLSVVSLAMYAVFNNGIKIWQRINKRLPQEDVSIFFDKFSRDLKNSIKFSSIKFSGRETTLEFAALINSPRLQKTTVGRVAYSYDPQTGVLNRQQDDYSQIYSASGEGSLVQSLNNIKSVKFQYCIFYAETKEYLWREEWTKEDIPLAVKIELEIEDGSQIRKFIQTVGIPAAA